MLLRVLQSKVVDYNSTLILKNKAMLWLGQDLNSVFLEASMNCLRSLHQ